MTSLLDRFLRYVRIDTQANEHTQEYPSSPGQWVLSRLLRDELLAMGCSDARVSEHGIVLATVPATRPQAPKILFNAHVDTSPEFSGKNVNPQVITNYRGGDLVLPADRSRVIRVSESPELEALVGKTIITTDGTTLLGGDDKAGIAVIMEAVRRLMEDRNRPCGPVLVAFTCDEEIGRGADHLPVEELGAVCGYTLDGSGTAEIEDETFSGDKATITITGVNIHPAIAKNRMTNAIRLAGMFLERLPKRTLTPETTEDRQGFIHPYHIEGGVPQATIHCILRDFETSQLAHYAEILREIGRQLEREYPAAKIEVAVTKQYRNMKDQMNREPRAVPLALEAIRRAGLTPRQRGIRGGTDGAHFTARGLPTPNLSTGEHNFHSPLEWVCLEELETNVEVVLHLIELWAQQPRTES